MTWFAVHTKPRAESLAQRSLAREGVATFYPKLRRKKTIRRVRRWVTGPLFPCYLFAQFDYNQNHRLVQYANGVTHIVNFGGNPAAVADEIISAIQAHCRGETADPDTRNLTPDTFSSSDTVTLEPVAFKPGEIVEIKSGPLMGLQGVFEREMPDRDRVVILLETLARGAKVQVSREELERIEG